MKKMFMIMFSLFLMLQTPIMADESQTSEEIIEEYQTPEATRRNTNALMYTTVGAMVIIGVFAYIVKQKDVKLLIDRVEENDDGSYTVGFGYKSSRFHNRKLEKEDQKFNVLNGAAIFMETDDKLSTDSRHKAEVIAVINDETEIEWVVDNQRLVVNKETIDKVKNRN